MPVTHNDLSNEALTRPLSHTIHNLINHHRQTNYLPPFEWDLSLYYLSLTLAKSLSKHNSHPRVHAYPASPCIGIVYEYSFAHTESNSASAVFEKLDHALWSLDGYIFNAVGGYVKRGTMSVVNVVSKGAAIPRTVCPLCDGRSHFNAANAAAVFGRLAAPLERRVGMETRVREPSAMSLTEVSSGLSSSASSVQLVPGGESEGSSTGWNGYYAWTPAWGWHPWYGYRPPYG